MGCGAMGMEKRRVASYDLLHHICDCVPHFIKEQIVPALIFMRAFHFPDGDEHGPQQPGEISMYGIVLFPVSMP